MVLEDGNRALEGWILVTHLTPVTFVTLDKPLPSSGKSTIPLADPYDSVHFFSLKYFSLSDWDLVLII